MGIEGVPDSTWILGRGARSDPFENAERPRGGFTLLEVMITVAVLSVLALSATLLLVPVSRQARINQEIQVAQSEATRVLESIQSLPFDEIIVVYPPSVVLEVPALNNGKLKVNYVDPETDPIEVQLVLSWSSSDLEEMQRIFTTARTR